MMVNNAININKTKIHLSPYPTGEKNGATTLEIHILARICFQT
jgi:hypothetical protein